MELNVYLPAETMVGNIEFNPLIASVALIQKLASGCFVYEGNTGNYQVNKAQSDTIFTNLIC